jgi:hypothetical protein
VVQIVAQMGRYFDEANFDVGGLVRMAHHTIKASPEEWHDRLTALLPEHVTRYSRGQTTANNDLHCLFSQYSDFFFQTLHCRLEPNTHLCAVPRRAIVLVLPTQNDLPRRVHWSLQERRR